jgi:ATP-dependent Clp protease ATP-binding subunit ClpC
MSYVKFPIAWWQDRQNTFYARTLGGTYVCAADAELKKCLYQIKTALVWLSENESVSKPDFEEPQLEPMVISFRSAEKSRGRLWPSKEVTRLTLPFVWGVRDDDSVACNFPTLGVDFRCDDQKVFRQMAIEQAQSELNGISQQLLDDLLPIGEVQVTSLNVRLGEFKDRDHQRKFEALESVASPLGGRQSKRMFNQAYCRDQEVGSLARLLQRSRPNILLVGPHGVGKSTILTWAAKKLLLDKRKVAKDDEELANQPSAPPVWMTSADRIVAGMQYLGEWEQRMEAVISELSEFQGILCFERLDALLRIGGQDASASVASFITPFLQNRELNVVIEATREQLDHCRMLLPGFDNLFQIFEIEPLSQENAWQVLDSFAREYKRNHRIEYQPETAHLCIRLFRRFMPYDTFPGKTVGFWKALFENAKREQRVKVSDSHVVDAFMDLTGLPESLVRDQVGLAVEDVRDWFKNRIIGQPEACQSLTNVIASFKAGLNDPKKPIGVMLFCGPTGVGKTETVKALTEFMFGNASDAATETANRDLVRQRLVRLDMSEFAGPGAGQRLTLKSDGQPGELVNRMRQQPFSIVLLDEIEKASPEVFDVLMSVLDEGRLTDRWGRVTDFRSSIIIMTSNLGVKATDGVGFSPDLDSGFEASVKKFFRPEFFNRIDRVVPFQALEKESILQITELELRRVAQREGVQSRNATLTWDDKVLDFLLAKGYSRKLGARPLQRAIERHVSVPLARLFAEDPKLGDCELKLVVTDGQVLVQHS